MPVIDTNAVATRTRLVFSCEHGGNRIPPAYVHLFKGLDQVLESHRAFDRGSLTMAQTLACAFRAPLQVATVSRLLVDLNRSIGHPQLHAAPVRHVSPEERQQILDLYYQPHRNRVYSMICSASAWARPVIHIASHSFTPELGARTRNADIGLLYDPARKSEAALCADWKAALQNHAPGLTIRRNYPYAGKNDGLTTWLRRCFPDDAYLGIELELNQKHVCKEDAGWAGLRKTVVDSLRDLGHWL
jgi:predicted N-formylglutamate amidohydrolase